MKKKLEEFNLKMHSAYIQIFSGFKKGSTNAVRKKIKMLQALLFHCKKSMKTCLKNDLTC